MEPTAIVPQVDQPPASSPGMSAAPSSVPAQDHAALRRRRRRRRVRSFSTQHGTQSKGDPPMSTRLMARLGAGSGIAYVGLIVVAGQIGPAAGIPATRASPHTIGTYIAHHPPSSAQWAGVYLEVLALLAFVVFVGYLWRVLRDAERDTGWPAAVPLSGGLLSAAIKPASLPAALAALYR